MGASLLAVLVVSILLAALARRFDLSAPLALVVAGLAASNHPRLARRRCSTPSWCCTCILPPLLWSAGTESSYVALRKNIRPIGLLAVGLPLATTFAVGFVAYKTVPELTVAAALTLGAIVAPPDAVSATAIGRRLGLPRRIMTLLGGESLLNDATALTAYKVALGLAMIGGIGSAHLGAPRSACSRLAAVGGVAVGAAFGALIAFIRSRLDDPLVESALGLVAPFVIYLVAEEIHGSGVLAVVVAALILGQRSTHAGYATRLQDFALWQAVQLILESFAFLLIGLQLPKVISELAGISRLGAHRVSSAGGVRHRDRASGSSGCTCSPICRGCCPRGSGNANQRHRRAGVRRGVGRHARRGVAGRGVRRSAHDAVG